MKVVFKISLFLLFFLILFSTSAFAASGFLVYENDFAIGTSVDYYEAIGGTIDPDHAFLVMYIAGTSAVNEPEEGSVSGYIYNSTHLRFQGIDAVSGTYVSWFVIEAQNEEFETIQRGELYMTTATTANTTDVAGGTDLGQIMVIGNQRCEGDNAGEWDSCMMRWTMDDLTTVRGERYKTDSQLNYGRYEVVEWSSDFNVWTDTLTKAAVTDTDLISGGGASGDATLNVSNSILFASWETANQGIQYQTMTHNISDTNELTFSYCDVHQASVITWYVVEFPSDLNLYKQIFAYYWAPSTGDAATHYESFNIVNTSRTAILNWGTPVDGTGTAFMRAFNLPRLLNSTHYSETQYYPASQVYDDHFTSASVVEFPYSEGATTHEYTGNVSDSIDVSDMVGRIGSIARIGLQSLILSSSLSRLQNIGMRISEDLSFGETTEKMQKFLALVSQYFSLNEMLTELVNRMRQVYEAIDIGNMVSRMASIIRSVGLKLTMGEEQIGFGSISIGHMTDRIASIIRVLMQNIAIFDVISDIIAFYELNIIDPTQTAPESVSNGQNITITFNFTNLTEQPIVNTSACPGPSCNVNVTNITVYNDTWSGVCEVIAS